MCPESLVGLYKPKTEERLARRQVPAVKKICARRFKPKGLEKLYVTAAEAKNVPLIYYARICVRSKRS